MFDSITTTINNSDSVDFRVYYIHVAYMLYSLYNQRVLHKNSQNDFPFPFKIFYPYKVLIMNKQNHLDSNSVLIWQC